MWNGRKPRGGRLLPRVLRPLRVVSATVPLPKCNANPQPNPIMNHVLRARPGLLALTLALASAFAFTAYAGPGPQHFARKNPDHPAALPATAAPPAAKAAACAGCKTTEVRVYSDRGPAGKGVFGWRTLGTRHECTLCVAAVAQAKAVNKHSTVTHASKCSQMSCCTAATE